MATVVAWNPKFSVGHPTLDGQHMELLNLINRIADCVDDQGPDAKERFHSALNDLSDYAKNHFRLEQQIIGRWNDSLLPEQQMEYEEYQDRLTNYLFSATFGTIDKAGLCAYLAEWWGKHILDLAEKINAARNKA